MTLVPWSGQRFVVAGGGGFLGSWFVRRLLADGARVLSLQRSRPRSVFSFSAEVAERLSFAETDLCDPGPVASLIAGAYRGADALICCAAMDGNSRYKAEHSSVILARNTEIVSTVLGLARQLQIRDVVLLSSSEVYSPSCRPPISETSPYAGFGEPGGNGYVMSKVCSELLGFWAAKQYGLRVYCPRLSSVYGLDDPRSGPYARVIPAMIERIRSGREVEIWGDGSDRRTFVYVEDAVRGILEVLCQRLTGPINVGTRESIGIADLARVVAEVFGRSSEGRGRPGSGVEQGVGLLDLTKWEAAIDFEPRSLETGLRGMEAMLRVREGGGGAQVPG